jgi:hypothetical protein
MKKHRSQNLKSANFRELLKGLDFKPLVAEEEQLASPSFVQSAYDRAASYKLI